MKIFLAEFSVNKVTEESRLLRQEIAIRTTIAIQVLSSEYNSLDSDQFIKATYISLSRS
jgi:hypothetical protein